MTNLTIRYAEDSDYKALCNLIGTCFAEFEGVFLDLENLDADLFNLRSNYEAKGGEVWVAEKAGQIVGCIGYTPEGQKMCELKRLYILNEMRGSGLAVRLLRLVELAVKSRGDNIINLWSDLRFERAHRFYEREGYVRQKECRILNDISNTTELQFIQSFEV